jgi:cholesterol transport system auxiliary component
MTRTGSPLPARIRRRAAHALLLASIGGCSALQPSTTPPPAFYSLDSASLDASAGPQPPDALPAGLATLIVNPPHAAAGFDSKRILYVRQDHKVESFAHSEWVDPPARMLAPLVVAAIGKTGAFRAVVPTPSAAAGDLRLDVELVRLQHEFQGSPSRVRLTLRAYIVDDKTRLVLARREFDASIPSASEDPYGGVVAANGAVRAVLDELAAFCAAVAKSRPEPNLR